MIKLIKEYSRFGIVSSYPSWKNRNTHISNNLSLFLGFIISIFVFIHIVTHPNEIRVLYGFLFCLVLILSIPFINKYINTDVGRTLLTLDMVAALLVFTVLRKLSADADNLISVYTFYLSRLFILIFSLLIFSYFHYSGKSVV